MKSIDILNINFSKKRFWDQFLHHNLFFKENISHVIFQASTNPFALAFKPVHAPLALDKYSCTFLFPEAAIQNYFGK